ncbi:SWIM zinc finger family protein [Kitasatospora acidiphila]|uniref:SWIM zinc finger family protein n=1 Tax=Kitasatospora acidiphila TaxID=2567942 RepID=UPI003C74274B
MDERWSTEQVRSLASDAAVLRAAERLAEPGPWVGAGAGRGAVWGLCRGGGSSPYRVVVEPAGFDWQCGCPGRQRPCQHVLGLLLLWSASPEAVPGGAEPPGWAACRLAERVKSPVQSPVQSAAPADPVAAARRAERRAARVAAGAQELRLRLADRIRRGLADPGTAGEWGEVAARMVDAQAPGLAAGARELAGLTGDQQLAGIALLDLLAAAYQRVDELPEPLAATVRTRVGFTTDSAELLAGRTVRDRWLVLGSQDLSEERLTQRRIWLRGTKTGHPALLLSYAPPGRLPELALPVGRVLEAELAYYPAAAPLRAVLGASYGTPEPGPLDPPPGCRLADAAADYGEAVAADPWQAAWPVVLSEAVPAPGPQGWLLTDGQHALPLHPDTPEAARWLLAAVSGGHPVTVFGECGHQGFRPITGWDDAGRPASLTTATGAPV